MSIISNIYLPRMHNGNNVAFHHIKLFGLLLIIFASLPAYAEKRENPVDLVNPLIDTHKPRYDYFASATLLTLPERPGRRNTGCGK
jgi:hypothetical protein